MNFIAPSIRGATRLIAIEANAAKSPKQLRLCRLGLYLGFDRLMASLRYSFAPQIGARTRIYSNPIKDSPTWVHKVDTAMTTGRGNAITKLDRQ